MSDPRTEIIRELDEKYNKICEIKVNAAIEHMEKRLRAAEDTNLFNMQSIRNGRMMNDKMKKVVDAASYCLRNGHVDPAAVLFTGLDKAIEELEGSNGTGPHR